MIIYLLHVTVEVRCEAFILTIIFYRNIDKNKALSSEIRSAMYIVPNLNTQNEVLKILHKIRNCDELRITGN